MKITDRARSGWPQAIVPYLRRSISQYRRSSSSLKIGITGGPHGRAKRYGSQYGEMILLYQTNSGRFVREIEAIMIDEYWEYCDNSIGGGGGSVSGPPYYLYLVRTLNRLWPQ